eukprot:TRINITY_DN90969_c0_g1_i1.p1 TRINITY_DN90969_c0_g1~~TRINITY_DN90969_c0_g1_i1.p1  ORF type:complete len:233 (-),score=46.06 TRINITY_DN90969_c0_g1_i1:150-848(-)
MEIVRPLVIGLCIECMAVVGQADAWDQMHELDTNGNGREFGGGWAEHRHVLKAYVQHRHGGTMLQIGCGTSRIAADMVADDEMNVSADAMLNTDFSTKAISLMQARHPALRWAVVDATALRQVLEPEAFDVVLEKGALATYEDYGQPEQVREILSQVWQVLKWGGVFLSISNVPANESLAVASADLEVEPGRLEWELEEVAATSHMSNLVVMRKPARKTNSVARSQIERNEL